MFPLRDHEKGEGRIPWITWALIAANGLIFLAFIAGRSDAALAPFFFDWGLVPARFTAGQGLSALFTSMFLHAGWAHLFGNMLFLWIYGDNLEERFGPWGFLSLYLLSGLIAGLLQVAAGPHVLAPMVGASGAVAGVMGAYLLLFPHARIDVLIVIVLYIRIIAVPAWALLTLWLALQIWGGLSTPLAEAGVAYFAHIGGFAAGALLALPFWRRQGGRALWHEGPRYGAGPPRRPRRPFRD